MYEALVNALRKNRSPHGATLRSEREDLERQKQRDQVLLDDPRTPQSVKDEIRVGHRAELVRIEEIERRLAESAATNPKRID